MIKNLLITSSIILGALSSAKATVRFVSQSGSGVAPYTSWATANSNLQTVLDASAAGDTVWVSSGNYQPPTSNGYTIPSNVKVIAGFNGTESTYSERDFNTNVSTISSPAGRAFYFVSADAATVLDGFTITGASQFY